MSESLQEVVNGNIDFNTDRNADLEANLPPSSELSNHAFSPNQNVTDLPKAVEVDVIVFG